MDKQTLLKQFAACYDENGWFVAVRNVLEGLTAEQAAWKPEATNNSVWESLAHLTYYNNAYVQRLKGIDYKYQISTNDETFAAPDDPSDEDWSLEVEKFNATMLEFRSLIENAEDAKLGEQVSETNTASWAELILNINAHNAYHGGQMLLIRKLQGSWNPENGVS